MSTVENSAQEEPASRHVLVVAPFRADAVVLGEMLRENGIKAELCDSEDQLAEQMDCCSVLVMSQEAMTPSALETVAVFLESQPPWSELPLILLVDDVSRNGAILSGLRRRLPHSKMMILQRPVRAVEFVSVIQTALLARRRQLQLRDHIEWQQELQRELNHRVKNILANVMAIYHMTLRQSDDLDAFADSFEGRLSALSQVHSALAVADQPQPLDAVAERVLAPYRSAAGDRVIIGGPPIQLQPDTAVIFALGLHELATNAAKYGAFSTYEGSVSLTWAFEVADSTPSVRIIWAESGGPPVSPPTRQGYGTRFVRSAMRGGTGAAVDIQYSREGLTCTFVIPTAKLAA
jgi:two-component sensor histidine kinase